MVIPKSGSFSVTRSAENGGNKIYTLAEDLEQDYASGALHPGDVKASLAVALNAILEPVRRHFTEDAEAARLLALVKEYRITK